MKTSQKNFQLYNRKIDLRAIDYLSAFSPNKPKCRHVAQLYKSSTNIMTWFSCSTATTLFKNQSSLSLFIPSSILRTKTFHFRQFCFHSQVNFLLICFVAAIKTHPKEISLGEFFIIARLINFVIPKPH